MDKETTSWRERGIGTLRINLPRSSSTSASTAPVMPRLVMRTEAVLRVILNAKLVPGLPVDLINERYVQFIALDVSGATSASSDGGIGHNGGDKPPGLTKFLVKVGKIEVAAKLLEVLRRFSSSPTVAAAFKASTATTTATSAENGVNLKAAATQVVDDKVTASKKSDDNEDSKDAVKTDSVSKNSSSLDSPSRK